MDARAIAVVTAIASSSLLVACGDGSAATILDGGADTGTDATSDTAPPLEGTDPTLRDGGGGLARLPDLTLAPPEIPWLENGEPDIAPPVFAPCPAGWSEVTHEVGVTTCEPWPTGEGLDCGPGEAQFAGDDACVPIGTSCPAGDFAEDLPASPTPVYVLDGAAGGGDGSLATPYATLAEVPFDSLPEGTTVALGKGRYVGMVTLPAGITLHGACVAETELADDTPGPESVVTISGANTGLRNLRIGTSARRGLSVAAAGASVTLTSVEVSETECYGVRAVGDVTLEADRLVVRDPGTCTTGGVFIPIPGAPPFDIGIEVSGGAHADLQTVFISGPQIGIYALPSPDVTELSFQDAVMRGGNYGLWRGFPPFPPNPAEGDLVVSGNRVVFEDVTNGFGMTGAGCDVDFDQVLVRNVSSAFVLTFGPTLRLRRTHATNVLGAGTVFTLNFLYSDVDAVLEDLLIDDTLGTPLTVSDSDLEMRRAVISRFDGTQGLQIVTSNAVVEDLRIADTTAPEELRSDSGELLAAGTGLEVLGYSFLGSTRGHASLELRRAIIEGARYRAMQLSAGSGAVPGTLEAVLEDVVLRGAAAPWNRGALIFGRATAEASRVLIDGTSQDGLIVGAGAELTLEDAVVRDTVGTAVAGLGGRGVRVDTAQLNAQRLEVLRSRDIGIGAWGDGTQVTLSDTRVEEVAARACADDEVACVPAGHGLGVYGGGLTAERFAVHDSALCGVQLTEGAEADLRRGEISGALVGLCLQAEPYDLDRVTGDVRYVDNATNLQATRLPVPDPAASEVAE